MTRLAERARMRYDLENSFGKASEGYELKDELRVQSGPFKGMLYPQAVASGSALTPKLLGSYEAELHRVVENLIAYQPSVVVDIGCAEGYYAVGFALRLPETVVHAFDIDRLCQSLCGEMAKANGVDGRVNVHGACTQADLESLGAVRSVVISDCEGFERILFDSKVIGKLRNAAFLIETHDFRIPSTSRELTKIFANTHSVDWIYSVSDFCRAQVFALEKLSELMLPQQIALMSEDRPAPMVWLWCRPKRS